jgi:phage gp45-like
VQSAQIEGYQGELRDDMAAVPALWCFLNAAAGIEGVCPISERPPGAATIVSIEDPRYRPRNQQPGETLVYMVDGAQADGTGGRMRALLKGALKWATQLFGVTIAVGDSNTTTVTIIVSKSVTIAAPSVVITNGAAPPAKQPQPVKLADGSNSTVLMAV